MSSTTHASILKSVRIPSLGRTWDTYTPVKASLQLLELNLFLEIDMPNGVPLLNA